MTDIAVIAFAILAYTYLGYPLLIAGLARVRGWQPSTSERYEPTVSVCMAVHDGARFIRQKVQSLLELEYSAEKLEILIYCDGCSDETERIAAHYATKDARIKLFVSSDRKGKPAALNALSAAAKGEVLLMTDVRPELARDAARALTAVLADPNVVCVSGNLQLFGKAGAGAYWLYEKFIRSREASYRGLVGVTGTIYAIHKRDFIALPEDLILDDMWVPLTAALRTHRRIAFCPTAQAYDEAFDDEREFGRKVRTLAGNYQLLARMPELLLPFASPVWFQLLSHKVLRLLCPWALLALFVCSSVMATQPHPVIEPLPDAESASISLWWVLASAQIAFYILAAIGPRAGRLATLARTFVVLNAAAVVGLWRFARGTQKVTW